MKHVAIVGGGLLGAELAKSLEKDLKVTLIEQNTHFVHAPAMVRAVVEPKILEDALIPYDKLLDAGSIIHARATSVDESGVTLENGDVVKSDFIVVATGSTNTMPFKANGGDTETLRANNLNVNKSLIEAQDIVIVGAGAVGTELAGEIAHHMPNKNITLIAGTDRLFPEHPNKLGEDLQSKLEAMGVTISFGTMVDNLQSLTEPYKGDIILSNGKQIKADLIFPVIGSKANSMILDILPEIEKSSLNRIKTDGWMRPSSLRNLFAAGDVVDMGDAMTVVASSRQKQWLSDTLIKLSNGTSIEDIKPYKPWPKPPILVPLGPKLGSSFLVLFTAGNFLTRLIKGKDLFLTKYNKLFNRNR